MPAEKQNAVRSLVESFVRSFGTLEKTAVDLDRILVCGLPVDEWKSARESYLEAAESTDLAQLATAQLDPAGLAWVIVGDWEAIRPGFEAQGLRPLEVLPF